MLTRDAVADGHAGEAAWPSSLSSRDHGTLHIAERVVMQVSRSMSTMRSLDTAACRAVLGLAAAFCLLAGQPSWAREWFDLNDRALAKFDFEGMALPKNAAELKQQFPQAERTDKRFDDQVGLACYVVRDTKNVDAARFFFCDDKLYQVELDYDLPRIEKMGGMQTLVAKLIEIWGPADHAGQSRWSWYRPAWQRRADFYAWASSAQLVITDTGLVPVVAERIKRADVAAPADLGFEAK
jgi:hypothetical protein